ncbi:MAG TPA: radical SAM family heme chaperone HemW [Actinomycetota bacterium]|nr:radical SAM family heme chaperone HemW [Actinomycetota bacterium]
MTALSASELLPAPTAAGARSGRWSAEPGFGVYVHIPFCRHRCHYCDFNTYEGQDELHAAYVDALVGHVEGLPGELPRATSIFFGGGTPTLLPPRDLGRILGAVRDRVGIVAGAEVTVEANPETVDEPYFEALLAEGFDRVSIGTQSLVPHVLQALGRTHGPDVARAAVAAARRAGVADVNVDLIYGSQWESPEDWERTLEGVLDLEPDHVSAYALTVEEGTPLGTLVTTGRVADVDPDVQAERHRVAEEVLSAAGFERYEVSNWARPGRASRHNVLYWSAGEYLGVGAGAHGHLAGRRFWSTRLPRSFIDAVREGKDVIVGGEALAHPERAAEALMLGLRLASGIELAAFERRFGSGHLAAIENEVERLVALGMVERRDGWMRIAPRATMVANDVITRLM